MSTQNVELEDRNGVPYELQFSVNGDGSLSPTGGGSGGGGGSTPAVGQTTAAGSLPVVLNSDQDIRPAAASTTVVDTASTSTAGMNGVVVFAGTPTPGSVIQQAINGQSDVTVTLSAVTGAVNFEVTNDGVNYVPITMRQRGSTYFTTSGTGVGIFEGDVSGKTAFRIRQASAGTTTATMTFSKQATVVQILNPTRVQANPGSLAPKTVTVNVNSSQQLVAANPTRQYLKWQVAGPNPCSIVCGAGPAVVGAGGSINYGGVSTTGGQGGSETFESNFISTDAFQVISTLGSSVSVWEG
jgi:hypothetical protein